MTYLEKNPQLCSILPKAETCADWMRERILTGNAQNVKAVVEYCRPELMTQRLQDIVSKFCQESLFYAALAPAQQTVHQVVQYFTFNLTVASNLSRLPVVEPKNPTAPASISTHLLLALSSMLIIILLALKLFRGGAGLIPSARTRASWLWSCRRPPHRNNSNNSISLKF